MDHQSLKRFATRTKKSPRTLRTSSVRNHRYAVARHGTLSRKNVCAGNGQQGEHASGDDASPFISYFERNPLSTLAYDRQTLQILAANQAVVNHYGYSQEELRAMTIKDIRPPEDVPYLFEIMRRDPNVAHSRHRKKDGTIIEVDVFRQRGSWGGKSIQILQIQDVTRERQAEAYFQKLLENAPDAVALISSEGKIGLVNKQFEKVFGYQREELLGQEIEILVPARFRERHFDYRKMFFADPHHRPMGLGLETAVRKDGTEFPAEISLSVLENDGETVVMCGIRDISQRKQAEKALLLELTSALISSHDVESLLKAVSAGIRQLKPHLYASLAFYDPEIKKLRLQVLKAVPGKGQPQEALLPLEGCPAGKAFTSQAPVLLSRMEAQGFDPGTMRRWADWGVRSACWLPLVSHNHPLGVLTVASEHEAAFTQEDVILLSRMASQVATALDNAMAFRQLGELRDRLGGEKLYLEEELRTQHTFEDIIGESQALKRVLKQVETVAATDSTVLLLGETGTGKERIARAIHNLSSRREKAFIQLNCAAVPLGLLESELFGHQKGAFTGAVEQRIGRMELAHQGTLLLDEIGDIPLELQPKLLRALQEKEFERLGSSRTIPVDVRLIAATNRNLDKMVEDGQFRSDLYYRLKVFPITIPPLRERREDIPLLVRYFVKRLARRMDKRIDIIPDQTMRALVRWSWPGNVRELENFIERAIILSEGPVLRAPLKELESAPEPISPRVVTLEAVEREHIISVLRETDGLIAGPHGAAARLGIPRTTLINKMKKLGISRKDL